jgi:hypothetical protein
MSAIDPSYTAALADARHDYAAAVQVLAAKQKELDELDTLIRRLRAVIGALANQLGEPIDLPAEDKPARRRKASRQW